MVVNENIRMLIQIETKFVPKDPIESHVGSDNGLFGAE